MGYFGFYIEDIDLFFVNVIFLYLFSYCFGLCVNVNNVDMICFGVCGVLDELIIE